MTNPLHASKLEVFVAVSISEASGAQLHLQVLSKFRVVRILMLVVIWKNMFSCSDHTRSLLWLHLTNVF